jgi:hypothetical protein
LEHRSKARECSSRSPKRLEETSASKNVKASAASVATVTAQRVVMEPQATFTRVIDNRIQEENNTRKQSVYMATILGGILSFKDRCQEAHREARKPVWCYRDPEAWQEDAGQVDKESAIRNLCKVEEGLLRSNSNNAATTIRVAFPFQLIGWRDELQTRGRKKKEPDPQLLRKRANNMYKNRK